MESRISSVSSLVSGTPVEGGADFALGVLSSSLSMSTGLLYLTREKVVPPPSFSILAAKLSISRAIRENVLTLILFN